MELAGKPMVTRVVERVKRANVGRVHVAIPTEKWAEQLFKTAFQSALPYQYPGKADDLVGRYAMVAHDFDLDIVVRIPADNPCIDPEEINRIVEAYNEDPAPWNWLTTNLDRDVLGNGYPGGLGAEIYDVRFLHWMDRNITDPRHREHPHLWAFDNHHVRTIQAPADIRRPWLDFSVNTQADFDFIDDIYRAMPEGFGTRDVLKYLDQKELSN